MGPCIIIYEEHIITNEMRLYLLFIGSNTLLYMFRASLTTWQNHNDTRTPNIQAPKKPKIPPRGTRPRTPTTKNSDDILHYVRLKLYHLTTQRSMTVT
jgi:hypothetical protein